MINKLMIYFKKQHEIFSLFKKQHEIFSLIMISSIYSSFKIIFETGFILLRKMSIHAWPMHDHVIFSLREPTQI